MSIKALPEKTVRAIGASQVLTDPSTVVKELIDNALDARASNIAVEIHANTLDLIQVRDNGHGIPPQDRSLVARRYCTSKITNADDLSSIGGSWLGFRGEALASAAEMSGGMTITTKVEGEQVATALKISQQGEVIAQDRASTAIGTTVKITDFIKSNPVRRQVALKHTDQCLKLVKHLLQGVAFARPHVRLSLRVLKAKNDKGNWTYAPKVGGNAEDAAFKVVGAACASQCAWSMMEGHGFSLQAFLPKSDAAAEKINNVGPFVSVDRRPVTVQRGIAKQINKIFRDALKKADQRYEGIKDPFMFLEIACPDRSYDPNVEPAKNNMLFEDPDKVVELARKLFAAVYTPLEQPTPVEITVQTPLPVQDKFDSSSLGEDDGFITALEEAHVDDLVRRPEDQNSNREVPVIRDVQQRGLTEDQRRSLPPQAFRSNMYGCDEEDLDVLDERPPTGRTEADFEELRQARKDVNISNPWVMAKMNASNKQGDHAQVEESPSVRPAPSVPRAENNTALQRGSWAPPTPRISSPPTSPGRAFHPSDHVPDFRLANDGRAIELPATSDRRSFDTPAPLAAAAASIITPSPSQQRPRPAYNYQVTPQLGEPQGTPLSAIPQARGRGRVNVNNRAPPNRPFVSPVVNESPKEKVWFDHLEGIEDRPRQRPRRRNNEASSAGLVQQGELEDLPRPLTPPRRNRDIRDFVALVDLTGDTEDSPALRGKGNNRRRNDAVNIATDPEDQDENVPNNYGALSGRGFVPASELAALEARVGSVSKQMAPPPKRRKTGERVLRQISGNALPAAEEPEADQEYRPETTTRRRSSAKLQRTKSSRLPLERIPPGKGTHSLAAKLSITPASIAVAGMEVDLRNSLLGWNEALEGAYDTFAEERSQDEVQAMSDKLQELLINRVSDREMVQDLGDMVSSALRAHVDSMAFEEEELVTSQEMLEVTQQ